MRILKNTQINLYVDEVNIDIYQNGEQIFSYNDEKNKEIITKSLVQNGSAFLLPK